MKYALLLCAVLLAGCEYKTAQEVKESRQTVDQCLRREVFNQCLVSVPKGPEVAGKYNDWDEVVSECATSAYRISIRLREQVKPECRAE